MYKILFRVSFPPSLCNEKGPFALPTTLNQPFISNSLKFGEIKEDAMTSTSNFNVYNINMMSFLLLVSLIIVSYSLTISLAFESEVEDETQFTYEEGTEEGPKNWGKINPHWEACGKGKMQSPIDVLDRRVEVFPNLGKLRRDYQAAPAAVKNRGHDITVIWKGDAGKITINDTDYQLQQCHWHSPSEHTFNGSRHDLELHLVHYSSQGGIAVVAIVYKYGRPDRFLSKLLRHINHVDHREREMGIVNPGDIKFGSRKYYRYVGSLTVPPCTEGVVWTIVMKVRTVSREQVKALRDAVHDGFEANARPTQPSTGIPMYEYRPRQNGAST